MMKKTSREAEILCDDYAGLQSKLEETYRNLNDAEQRTNLLETMKTEGLYTRDILSFITNQKKQRRTDKDIDRGTANSAMDKKIRDMRLTAEKHKRQIKNIKNKMLVVGTEYKLRKSIKLAKKKNTTHKEKKERKYKKKLEHYRLVQCENIFENGLKKKFHSTKVPRRLIDYAELCIFKTPKDLPEKEPSLGPYVCDPSIKLSEEEIMILNKDPKFSLMEDINDVDFRIELEKMLYKHRINENGKKRINKSQKDKIKTFHSEKDNDKDLDKWALWKDCKHRYIYDPFKKDINFNWRRVTDYKMNKRIMLPKALDPEAEFQCETRRRKFWSVFNKYKQKASNSHNRRIGTRNKNEKEKNGKTSTGKKRKRMFLNLNAAEEKGLKSLIKRINANEIMVTSTDKSSRMAVLSTDQYLKSGFEHTTKDEKVSWNMIKYFQNQVNSHVWWLSKILGYCEGTDPGRMNKNLSDDGFEVPELAILIKDHKSWTFGTNKAVPSRPIVNGSKSLNSHLSEIISEIIEPVTNEMVGAEISSSEEALYKLDNVNENISKGMVMSDFNILNTMQGDVTRQCTFSAQEENDQLMHPNTNNDTNDLLQVSEMVPISDPGTEQNMLVGSGSGEQNMLVGSGFGEQNMLVGSKERVVEPEYILTSSNKLVNSEDILDTSNRSLSDGDTSLIEELDFLYNNRDSTITEQEAVTKRKRQTTMSEYIAEKDKIGTKDEKKEMKRLTRIELESRKQFLGKRGTLNERIVHGHNAGMKWAKIDEFEKTIFKNMDPGIQDFENKPVMIGGDVKALYPSLDGIATAQIAADSVRRSKVKFSGINVYFLMVYLFLVLGRDGMTKAQLQDCIPARKNKSNAMSLSSIQNRNMNTWDFSNVSLTENKIREMIANMLQVAVLTMVSTTCYSFGGYLYRQKHGLGIGLRASAALARCCMCRWDQIWAEIQSRMGLKVILFYRYIDDLRLLLYPIKEGWEWINNMWVYKGRSENTAETMEARTKRVVGDTFNGIWRFLEFTTEGGEDFDSNYLPTLDFETFVTDSGMIKYRDYMKPMSNNRVLQFGTALSKNCIFSSLRQDMIRRLLSINDLEGHETRMAAIKKYIQLMRNSNHTFVYIKSVILQALTKFMFMTGRSKLAPSDKLFKPLHRSREFDGENRMLEKYLNHSTWYKSLNVGDMYKDLWKRNITRKGSGGKANYKKVHRLGDANKKTGEMIEKDTTTTLFVPQSPGGQLLLDLEEMEKLLQEDNDIRWRCKLVERPGIPIALKLLKKFPPIEGCPLGQKCKVCDNLGIKCANKGVVYSATCQLCTEDVNNDTKVGTVSSHQTMKKGIYIGETARPLRSRAKEHMDAVENFKKESFIIEHWMIEHGLEPSAPTFKFKTLGVYKNAMTRQLSEAIQILDQGSCNRKSEFSNNELIRMESYQYSWEREQEEKMNNVARVEHEKKVVDFINVMSNVCRSKDTQDMHKTLSCYRSKKRSVQGTESLKKRFKMNTSTPLSKHERREVSLIEISDTSCESLAEEVNLSNGSGAEGEDLKKNEELPVNIEPLRVSRKEKETKFMVMVKNFITMEEHAEALAFFKHRRSRSYTNRRAQRPGYITKEMKPDITSVVSDLLRGLDLDKWSDDGFEKSPNADNSLSTMDESNYFDEEEIDDQRLAEKVKEMRKNCLPKIFVRQDITLKKLVIAKNNREISNAGEKINISSMTQVKDILTDVDGDLNNKEEEKEGLTTPVVEYGLNNKEEEEEGLTTSYVEEEGLTTPYVEDEGLTTPDVGGMEEISLTPKRRLSPQEVDMIDKTRRLSTDGCSTPRLKRSAASQDACASPRLRMSAASQDTCDSPGLRMSAAGQDTCDSPGSRMSAAGKDIITPVRARVYSLTNIEKQRKRPYQKARRRINSLGADPNQRLITELMKKKILECKASKE